MTQSNMPDEPTDEELELKLRKLLGEEGEREEEDPLDLKARELQERTHRFDLPEVPGYDDEFGQRIKDLEGKANKAKAGHEAKKETVRKAEAAGTATGLSLQQGLSLAYTIIGLPLMGVAIGWFIDNATGGVHAKEIGMLVGCVVGIWMAFLLITRANKKG